MKKKLTLTIDEKVKIEAKKAAKKRGVSVSQLVESYLKSISRELEVWKPEKGSVVSKLSGSIEHKEMDKDYSDIVTDALVEKYGRNEGSD